MPLDALTLAKLTGEEAFSGTDRIVDDAPVGHSMTVLDFWRWSASDLLSNTMRGIVAEYIVAKALGLTDQPREEWRAYDLETKDGIREANGQTSTPQLQRTQWLQIPSQLAPRRDYRPG